MARVGYQRSATVSGLFDYTGTVKIFHEVNVTNTNGGTATVNGTLYFENDCDLWTPDSITATIASAKAYFNGTLKKSIGSTSWTDKNLDWMNPGSKTLGSYSVAVSKAHSAKDLTFKLTAGKLTIKVVSGGSSSSNHNDCGTKSGTITIPARTHYTVSYNANGGSGAPGSQTKWYGETLTLSTTKPTRTGYTFAGWYTAASGGTKYGTTYTGNSNATLYAHWTANTYTLYYNANGGSVSPTSVSRTYGSQYGTLPTPTRTGYNYVWWYTAASGGNEVYSATLMGAGNATIYAHWTEKTANLIYNNGGHGTAPGTVTMRYTAQTTAAAAISEEGWLFQGWKRSDNEAIIQPGAIVKAANVVPSTITLTAQWIPDICHITLNNNEADVAGTQEFWTKYEQDYYSDSNCMTPIVQIIVPQKEHYNFNGYYFETTKYINADGTFVLSKPTFTSGIELNASWIPQVYEITLDDNGAGEVGTIKYYEKYSIDSYEDEACTVQMSSIVIPKKIGYTFNGYYITDTQYINESGQILQKNIGANSELLAMWTINNYNLIFNPNGGKINNSTDLLSVSLQYNEQYSTQHGAFPQPTRVGYTFNGWYATPEGSDDAMTDYTMGARDYVLYARWTPKVYDNIDNSYNYTTIETGKVAVTVKENSSFGFIPYSILDESDTLVVSSLENCFKDKNVNGYIYMNCSAVNNVDGIFDNVSNNVCIVFGSEFEEFSDVWDTINQTYENVTYLGADDEDYYYTADENNTTNHNLNIRVKDKTKEMYNLPTLNIQNDNDIWTPTTMDRCYKGCQNLQGILPVHNNPSSYIEIFDEIGENNIIQIWCLNSDALTTWETIANDWQ